MRAKALRIAMGIPLLLAVVSWFQPLFAADSPIADFLMTPYAAFGVTALAFVWLLYFFDVWFARSLLLAEGLVSLAITLVILASYFLRFNFPLEQVVVPEANSPFLLNLAYMFLASYLIQVLIYWSPKTKQLINALLAVILFMSLLSIFGQLYSQTGIRQEAILLPMPLSAIISFLVFGLVVFVHNNSMDRLYLNSKIVSSFALLFLAVIGANIVVFRNINQTTTVSTAINNTRNVLTESHNVDLYLRNALADVQTYETSNDPAHIISYQQNKQAYNTAMKRLTEQAQSHERITQIDQSIESVAQIGTQLLTLGDNIIRQSSAATDSADSTVIAEELESYKDQVLGEIKAINLVYTNQLNTLTEQESSSNRGIVLGVSITSALSLLLIIFTPLFVRQTIQKLTEAEKQLKTSNRLLSEEKSRAEAILTSVGDGLFVVDSDQTVILFNQAARDITGFKKQAILGQQHDQVLSFSDSTNPEHALNFISAALTGTSSQLSHNITLHGNHGKLIDVQVSASPIKNKDGSISGAIVVFRDRSNEQALENAKDEFVSLASHQLRTPATATKQFLAMFLQGYAGDIDKKQKLFLQQAYDNNELGINIIEKLLNVTRLESKKLKLVNERIELNQFLRTATDQHAALATKQKQKLRFVASAKPAYIKSDASLLEMAVDNLITNALKYSEVGDTITVQLIGGDRVKIEVSDTGIGIRKEDLHKIFERFSRLEDHQKQHVSGTGIGLYLVKKIAHQLHATISVESEYGKGSTFVLTFKSVD